LNYFFSRYWDSMAIGNFHYAIHRFLKRLSEALRRRPCRYVWAFALGLCVVMSPGIARAACTSPTGAAGDMIYNTDHNVMQFCDGTNWIGMAGAAATSETDPKIGTLTNTKWCTTDGSVVNCTSDAPAGTPAGADGQIQFNDGGTAFGADAALHWDNTNKRLGIGTATPGGKIHLLDGNTGAHPSIIFDDAAADTDFWMALNQNNDGNDNDSFQIGKGITPGTNPLFVIDKNGNVGIGTTSPTVILDVAGSIISRNSTSITHIYPGFIEIIRRETNATNVNGYLDFKSAGGEDFDVRLWYDGTNNEIKLSNGETDGFSTTDLLTVERSGNVGIGTTAPDYKFAVGRTGGLNFSSGGTQIGFCTDVGCLPGYPSGAYPLIKTNSQFIYFSANGAYSGYVSSGGFVNVSSRSLKENFQDVDPQDVLTKLEALPVMRWNYKTDDPSIQHIGPFAEDFHDAFGLNGTDNTAISDSDRGGVALAAIKGLIQQLRAFESENHSLKAQNTAILQRLEALEAQNAEQKADNADLRLGLDKLRSRIDALAAEAQAR